jgi:hypothetical protein
MNSIQITSSQLKELNEIRKEANADNKNNYELWKMNYEAIKIHFEQNPPPNVKNSNLLKCYLLFTKSLVIIHAGLYNNDKPLFEKGLNKLKKSGLDFLDAIANSETSCLQFCFIGEEKTIESEEKYKNDEAYRQYAMFLKKQIDKFNDMNDYWFLEFKIN